MKDHRFSSRKSELEKVHFKVSLTRRLIRFIYIYVHFFLLFSYFLFIFALPTPLIILANSPSLVFVVDPDLSRTRKKERKNNIHDFVLDLIPSVLLFLNNRPPSPPQPLLIHFLPFFPNPLFLGIRIGNISRGSIFASHIMSNDRIRIEYRNLTFQKVFTST